MADAYGLTRASTLEGLNLRNCPDISPMIRASDVGTDINPLNRT